MKKQTSKNIEEMKKPVREYPCLWEYKIIGFDEEQLREAISLVMSAREHIVTFSNSSSTGKYVSLNLELVVVSELDRDMIYCSIKAHAAVKLIL